MIDVYDEEMMEKKLGTKEEEIKSSTYLIYAVLRGRRRRRRGESERYYTRD